MISAYVEAMFDALEHRLWIGPLPVSANDTMFSMREGTIFSEEVLGGQRRCSLPSLSVLYGASAATAGRTFGDPQNVPVSTSIPTAGAGPSTATTTETAPAPTTVPARPVQGLPSPPASPASSAPGTPPQTLSLPPARVIKPLPPARRALSMPRAAPAPKSQSGVGHFNFAEWRARDAQPMGHGSVSLPPPPNPSTQHPHLQLARSFKPPPVYHLPIPRVTQPSDSPVFDVTQWCTPIPELAEDSTAGADMDISPPHTPADAFMSVPNCDSRPADTFDPRMWAAQVQVDPSSSLVTPAPTVRIGESSETKLRYPSATLMPSLDPAWNGRRHSIAVSATRC